MNLTKIPAEVQAVPEIDQNNLLQEIFQATLNKSEKKFKLLVGLRANLESVHSIAVAFGNTAPMYFSIFEYSDLIIRNVNISLLRIIICPTF